MRKEEVIICLLIDFYLSTMLDVEISNIEIQNIIFFLKEIGEPLDIKFDINYNIPHSIEIENILNDMIKNDLIKVYVNPQYDSKTIEISHNTLYNAYEEFKKYDKTTKDNIKRVEKIITNFETPYGLRLLSTVYIMKFLKNKSFNDICYLTKFIREQVQTAITHLNKNL